MKKSKKKVTIILVVIFIAGLSLLLYPTVANTWNKFHQSQAINTYTETVAKMSQEEYDRLWQEAVDFNANIKNRSNLHKLDDDEMAKYNSILNISGDGIIGSIEIPSIDVILPIYHGISDRVLQNGVGHIEWSSLPVGGLGQHCVLSGHRGLPSARLFTDLDRLVEGDIFTLTIMEEVLTYEVDQISIVLPEDVSKLEFIEGEDYCTLITCTPYGINTHRLLVRGHRIENLNNGTGVRVISDAVQIEPLLVAVIIGIPLLALSTVAVLLISGKRGKRNKSKKEIKGGEEREKD